MRRTGNRAVSWLVVAVVTAMLSPVSMSFAAVANNEVTSAKIKEADGTSGQDTNLGSGVKTGHIQDGAITTSKIVDGSVTDAKIVGPIAGSKLGAHGHNASDIIGTISASNMPIGTIAGTVAAGDHSHDSAYQKKYANTTVVAKGGGDYMDPIDALSNLANWCGTPSATNHCLLKIMPGNYDLGSNELVAANFVDIDGSGINNTIITGSAVHVYRNEYNITQSGLSNLSIINNAVTYDSTFGVVLNGASEIRNVFIKTNGKSSCAIVSGNATMVDVTIDAPYTGIQVMSGESTYKNIKILNAPGFAAFYNYRGNVIIKNMEMEPTLNVWNQGNMTIINSTIGKLRLIGLEIPTTTNVANTHIVSGMTRDNGSVDTALKCFNAYDANYMAIDCNAVPPTW